MMSNLPKYLLTIGLFFGVMTATASRAHAAPKIYFTPTSVTAAQNSEFTIDLMIDAESNQTIGSDTVVSYASADIEVVSVTTGGFYPEFQYADNETGRMEIHSYVTSVYQAKTGSGKLATLRLKSTKNSGSSALSMTCDGSGNDTNILNDSGTNILTCGSVNQVAISYTGSGSTGSTATPTPTTQPSGNSTPTCTSMTVSATNLQGTPQPITLSCSGTDSDGYVNAAEFTFGDGTKQVVEKNIGGQGGSISTTHTYTTVGTMGASCRVRDNNTVYSSVPAGCKQTITIRPKPTSAAGTGGTNVYRTPTPTRTGSTGSSNIVAATTPKPTAPVVSIISVTPLPTFPVFATPTPAFTDESSSSGRFWWIVGGIVSLLLAFLLLKKRKPPKPNAPGTPPTPIPPIIVENTGSIPQEPPPSM